MVNLHPHLEPFRLLVLDFTTLVESELIELSLVGENTIMVNLHPHLEPSLPSVLEIHTPVETEPIEP